MEALEATHAAHAETLTGGGGGTVDRHPWLFALVGAGLVGTAAFLLSPTLIDGFVACGTALGDIAGGQGCAPNRTTVLGILQLSDTEMVVWCTIVGILTGALLGLLTARLTSPSVDRRTRFLVFGTLIGVAAGLFFGLSIEDQCIQDGEFLACRRKWFFGSQLPALAAVALWISVGGIAGSIVGWTTTRLTHSHRAGSSPSSLDGTLTTRTRRST